MTAWSIEPLGGVTGVAIAAILLGSLLTISTTSRFTSRRKRRTLIAFRAASLLLLLAMMLRPSIEYRTMRRLPGTLILLSDQSRSMTVADSLDDATRWDAVRKVLNDSANVFDELAESWDIRCYAFADAVDDVAFEDGKFALPELAEGSQSAIGAALEDVLAREAQKRIVGVLLLSDGAQRAFAPRDLLPQEAVRRMAAEGIPLFTFTFGKPSLGQQSDLRVSDFQLDDSVFADTPAEAQAVLSVVGYANQTVNVQMLWEDATGEMQAVDAKQITIEQGRQRYPLRLSYTPKEAGEYKVSVRVEPPEGELVTANNAQSTFVSVLKGGVKVLYLVGAQRIGGGPDDEPYFVRDALAGFPDLNVQYQLLTYRKPEPEVDLREQLRQSKYDVFLLGNVDVSGLSNATWRDIAAYVDSGAGLGMLGGFHSFGPGGFRNSPLADVLPIQMDRTERQAFDSPIRTDVHVPGPLRLKTRAPHRRPAASDPAARRRCRLPRPVERVAGAGRGESLQSLTDQADSPGRGRSRQWTALPIAGRVAIRRRSDCGVGRRHDVALATRRLRRPASPLLATIRTLAGPQRRRDRQPRLGSIGSASVPTRRASGNHSRRQ